MPEAGYTVVALAGGSLEPDFRAAGYTAANKAYLPIKGAPMLERVLRAFRGARSVGRIRVVTQPDAFAAAFGERANALADDVIAPGGGLIDSMLAGFAGLAPDQRVLVSATDLALLTPSSIDVFTARADEVAKDADIGYGFVSRHVHDAKYPHVRHTWVHLHEGVFCGAGISMLRAGSVAQTADLLRRVAALRKSPLRLAMLFSPSTWLRMLTGSARIAELEARADEMSGLRCRGVLCDVPELAVNVDRLADLRMVETLLH
ncbi:MAG: nucleotidyltransferase family protein [Candidatus Eremiobacteraeota bacterium]|nr:nucleotidyltransferase family protein [Candidatus Eremiobacteraeota bacterium]MBV8366837.1 nucleotidyltransferase family protein [Candidatus Eremiobacteraeota bacterium]